MASSIIEERWSKPVVSAGWTALPSIILDKQKALGLKPTDINVLLQIIKYWFEVDKFPFPAVGTIADAMGVTPRTVQRSVEKMEKLGYLKRHVRTYAKGGQKSNKYTFEGLIKACTPYAEEALEARKKKKKAEVARIRRKAPLQLVQ